MKLKYTVEFPGLEDFDLDDVYSEATPSIAEVQPAADGMMFHDDSVQSYCDRQEAQVAGCRDYYMPDRKVLRVVEPLDTPEEKTRIHGPFDAETMSWYLLQCVRGTMPINHGTDARGLYIEF